MIGNIVRGITRWGKRPRKRTRSAEPRPHPTSHTEASATRGPVATGSRRSEDSSTVTEAPQPDERAELRAWALREVTARAATLSDAVPLGVEGSDNAQKLLDVLVRKGPGAIRQPPNAAQAVLEVTRRASYSTAALIRLIEQDPALAQSLLKHANSAFYAVPGSAPIVAIHAAIQRIGANGVNSTVMSSIIAGGLSRPGAEFNEPAKMVWDHMVRVAPLARRFSRVFSVDPEAAFTLGLVHDVGKLVVFDQLGSMRHDARKEIHLPERFLSNVLMGLHEPIGALVALQWGMAADFARAVAGHHRHEPPSRPHPLAEVTFLAERLDLHWQRDEDVDLDLLWSEGRLTGSVDGARQSLNRLVEENSDSSHD